MCVSLILTASSKTLLALSQRPCNFAHLTLETAEIHPAFAPRSTWTVAENAYTKAVIIEYYPSLETLRAENFARRYTSRSKT